jgi:hypothetical protein
MKIVILLSTLIHSFSSHACFSPQYENYVLLNTLPAKAYEKPVVAKVRLLVNNGSLRIVRVTEAIKGVVVGQEFEVQAGPTSCSHLESRVRFMRYMDETEKASMSDDYYLAGEWDKQFGKQVFIGYWQDAQWFPKRLQERLKLLNSPPN